MADNEKIVSARETMETMNVILLALLEISNLLNTGLDAESLASCVRLCENGCNPEALALVIQELRRESAAVREAEEAT